MSYFSIHNHTHYSNIRLLDSINKPKDLIDKAISMGLTGLAITDHECLSSHMEVNKYAKELKDKYPNFKVALGNEIYLVNDRTCNQKYFHFILIAKDAVGHKALRELSSIAWQNMYADRAMRVPTTKNELRSIIQKYQGHVIASTACLAGELSVNILDLTRAEIVDDKSAVSRYYSNIINFLEFCKEIFQDDFYLECAPATTAEQIIVNKRIIKIGKALQIKVVFGVDAHYLSQNDRFVHKAYLTSQPGDREVDDFYEFSRLMDGEEVKKLLLNDVVTQENIQQMFNNTQEIANKIEFYSLEKPQRIPEIKVKSYEKKINSFLKDTHPTLQQLMLSENEQERYWVNECFNALAEKNLLQEEYIARLEIEADIVSFIGNKLNICLYAYFNTFKHCIDIFWNCGSIVGPGRGSATGFLSNYLLGITQLDPIRWELPYWRFLNKERAELPSLLLILGSCKKRTLTVA